MTTFTRPLALFILFLLQFSLIVSSANAQSSNGALHLDNQIDIRILVDVSGSMKKTDPLNLRVPALQVLTQLLPENAQAGVWAFADEASLVVPHGAIDSQWRARALAAAQNIRSNGQYTDIGGALQTAAFGEQARTSQRNLHVILLTDGMVDVAKNEVVNIRARNELLQHITQQYVDAGALVHAIGLSHAVDEKTLNDIARRTDGLFAVAENADQLLDIFLRALDNSVLTQQAPVSTDRQTFVVNDDTESITVVVEKNGDQAVALQSPDGEVISANETSKQVAWQESSTHDVVTVQQPEQGTWTVASNEAAVTRVNVQGKLQMDLRLPSNNIYLGQSTPLQIALADASGAITDPELLSRFALQLSLENDQQQVLWQHQQGMSSSMVNIDMPAQQALGLYRLRASLRFDDKIQEVERSLRVHPPIDYVVSQQQVANTLHYKVAVTPLFKQLDLDASHITLTGQRMDRTAWQKSISLDVDKWQGSWHETQALQALSLLLDGVTLAGDPVVYQVETVQVSVLTPKQVAQQQQAASVAVEDLPAATVIEVEETAPVEESGAGSNSLAVSQEEATDDMQALMQESDESTPESTPEPTPAPEVQQPQVTIEAEPAVEEVDNRIALFGILLFIFLAILIWVRLKSRSQAEENQQN